MLDSQQIDDAIIVNGNYQNQSEWINSLSPQMVRQPILLLTSNGDDIATPYQMTLMYNKFSSDSIIHMGGVYHADQNDVFFPSPTAAFMPPSRSIPRRWRRFCGLSIRFWSSHWR